MMIKKLNTLADTIFEMPGTKVKVITLEDLRQFLKRETYFVTNTITDSDLISGAVQYPLVWNTDSIRPKLRYRAIIFRVEQYSAICTAP